MSMPSFGTSSNQPSIIQGTILEGVSSNFQKIFDKLMQEDFGKLDSDTAMQGFISHRNGVSNRNYEALKFTCVLMYRQFLGHGLEKNTELKQLAIVVGSWVFKFMEIRASGIHCPDFDKPLLILMKDREKAQRLINCIYWTMRLQIGFPTNITVNQSVTNQFESLDQLSDFWDSTLTIMDISPCTRPTMSAIKELISRLMIGWFHKRYPLILVGHVSQQEPIDKDKHKILAEFIV